MTRRKTPEWIGKSPDAKIPPRVRLKIFQREQGKCYLSDRKIQPGEHWELDHKTALCNGGEHRESNLFPALCEKHREKTAADVKEKAKVDRLAKKHIGIHKEPSFRKAKPGTRYVQGPHGLRASMEHQS